jgi:hypothetical protein
VIGHIGAIVGARKGDSVRRGDHDGRAPFVFSTDVFGLWDTANRLDLSPPLAA